MKGVRPHRQYCTNRHVSTPPGSAARTAPSGRRHEKITAHLGLRVTDPVSAD